MKIPSANVASATLLEALQASLIAAGRHSPAEVPPAAILWTDTDGQWKPLIASLRNLMPQLITLGSYMPSQRQGPAIWVRCVIEGALPEVSLPNGVIPIIYLPGVSRQTLRNVEDCPWELQPIVELQYRGNLWCQRNGRDWTVEAFLIAEEIGLELAVSRDAQTKRAMLGALAQLAVTPISRLQGKHLEAEDFDKLMIEDTPRNLLEWLNDPRATQDSLEQPRWAAFCSRCKAEYAIDPVSDGDLVAGERLGLRNGAWLGVWERFVEAPALYPKIPDLLRRAKPAGLTFERETWPDENDDAEKLLRKALSQLGSASAVEAHERINNLEGEHAVRRKWVWAKLGLSPLANALAHLAALAKHTHAGLGGDSTQKMAALYAQGGYLADDAVLRALATVKTTEDFDAVSIAARAMYLPWLQDAAEHFQMLVAANPLPAKGSDAEPLVSAEVGTCILFVDGLRFDLGQRLTGLLQDRKMRVNQSRRWAAVPTVTGTAKPAVSPISMNIIGQRLGDDFVPEIIDANQSLTFERMRKLLTTGGYQCIPASEVGLPQDAAARAWTEYGEFDKLGHDLQAKLALRIDDQLELLGDRIETLLAAGWRQIRVVTDHGWLLVPGGLPSMSLPKYLTASRWSRCAVVKTGAQVSVPTAGWYWNPSEIFAFGAGVRCFGNGNQYAHGGISLQECVIPDLVINIDMAKPEISANIVSVQWVSQRCRVTVECTGAPISIDIRTKVGDSTSSISIPKTADSDGKAALLVEDDALVGTTVSVVLLDSSGRVVAKQATTVGGEE